MRAGSYRSNLLSGLMLMIVFLYGCSVGPEYSPPEIDAPAAFESQAVLDALVAPSKKNTDVRSSEDRTFQKQSWWFGFKDSKLSQLIETALKHNYDLVVSRARIKEAEARIVLADAGDSVQATLSGGVDKVWEKEISSSAATERDRSIFSLLGVLLPIDLFGRTRRAEEAARADLEGAYESLRGNELRVSTEVAAEYLQIRGTQQQLALLRKSVVLQEKTLTIVKSRFDSGLSPELDLRRAEAAVENLRADIPPLEQSLIRSRQRLSTLAGKAHLVDSSILKDSPSIPTFNQPVVGFLPLTVLSLRPDVRQAEAELKRSIAAIGVAEAQFYPFLNVGANISIAGVKEAALETVDIFVAQLSASLQQFVLDGGVRSANLQIAHAQAEQALASYRLSLLLAIEDVETLLAGMQASLRRRDSLSKAVKASERSFFQAESLYRQGLTSFLDVVDSQRVLASAQQALAAEQTRYAVQIANLFQTLGTNTPYVDSKD